MQGKLIVLSGPSGVGKGTIVKRLFEDNPTLCYSVSATTRAPRAGETEGISYYFMTKPQFLDMVDAGGFLEWAELFGNCYGTPSFAVDKHLQQGRSVVLEIDTQGALQVMEKRPECISIFILPPSYEELVSRIRGRGTETEEVILHRLEIAVEEMELASKYKYTVINDDLDNAVAEIEKILIAEQAVSANKE